jgi:N-acetylneuraminate synthase/N,N'-diacetyllegionaminate synthase
MQLFGKNLEKDVVYIAEIGVNHEGDFEYAKTLLRLAAASGADAVKFQSYTPDRYASASNPERLERVTKFALSEDQFKALAALATELGVHFFSTPLSEDWVEILDPFVEVFKIASGDITFEPVVRAAARTGKSVIISTGGASEDDIDKAVSWLHDEIGESNLRDRLIIMQCVCAYPASIHNANVNVIQFLKEKYNLNIGYSNHIVQPEACYAAIALGASVVEVHFTDKKTERDFHDHALSFEPHELKSLVSTGNAIKASLGERHKALLSCEIEQDLVRKGLVAASDLEKGHVLEAGDMMYARPANEIPANKSSMLIGKTLKHSYRRGEQIAKAELET